MSSPARPVCLGCVERVEAELRELAAELGVELDETATEAELDELAARVGPRDVFCVRVWGPAGADWACPRCSRSRAGDVLGELAPNRAARRRMRAASTIAPGRPSANAASREG